MKRKIFACLLGLLLIHLSAWAHVGNPGVVFQGKAGPYTLMANVNPPDVIPGTATVSVYLNTQKVTHIYMLPVYWFAGEKGSPKEDEALPVNGLPGQYQGTLWLMQTGVASIKVIVEGPQGKGSVIVPVMAVSTAQKTMPRSLDWILGGLGILLLVLMITIIGASVSDGLVKPGEQVGKSLLRKRLVGMGLTASILGLILWGGATWWNTWSARYKKYLYKAPLAHTRIISHNGQRVLELNIDSAWLRKNSASMSYIVPDHGKLMHLFLIKENTLDAFAHLHPLRKDSNNYLVNLPDMPAGRYLVFADVVHWNGFAETISDTINIPAKPVMQTASTSHAAPYADPDDTYMLTNSILNSKDVYTGKPVVLCGQPGNAMRMADGSTAVWQHRANVTLEANRIYPLTFAIRDTHGAPAQLQPYMGMMGHAVVMKDDGSVYVHLHPVGNYSMVSQEIIQSRMSGSANFPQLPDANHFRDSIDQLMVKLNTMSENQRNRYLNTNMQGMNMPAMTMSGHEGGMVTFPYAFPNPGKYRIWVQTKVNGRIENSAFDADVK